MSNNFYGEYQGFSGEVDFRKLPPLKKFLAVTSTGGTLISLLLTIFPLVPYIGIFGLAIFGFIYLPLAIVYIFEIPKGRRTAAHVLNAIGVLIIAVYGSIRWYDYEYGMTEQVMGYVIMIFLFLIFSVSGIVMLRAGIKRQKKWDSYSYTTQAVIVTYKEIHTNAFTSDDISPNMLSPMNQNDLFSPIFEYTVNGKTYRDEIDSYYGASQLPPIGSKMEIHVDPDNVHDYILKVQNEKILIFMGTAFALCSPLPIIVLFIIENYLK